ncbi:MAG: T9SS type A sorting domain-containing protein [Bacteroidota bacterium]
MSYSFELTDMIGNSVKAMKNINSNSFQISRNDLQNGMYFYRIYQAGNIVGTGKLVIQ